VVEFTALRQEVNLQTKAARAQLEQNAEALQQLEDAAHALDEARAKAGAEDRGDEIMRPLLKTLVDVFEALALARREVERVQKTMAELLAKTAASARSQPERVRLESPHAAAPQPRPWWRWWQASAVDAVPVLTMADLKARLDQQEKELTAFRQAEATGSPEAGQARQVLASILVGYTMGLQRLERALTQHELEPIDCVGEPFDPECMEVVEVVAEPGRQGTEVVEEVRRGYRWRGRLFRAAQVRVSRP